MKGFYAGIHPNVVLWRATCQQTAIIVVDIAAYWLDGANAFYLLLRDSIPFLLFCHLNI